MRAWLTPPRPAAERALEQLNYTKINDKPIRLMWSHRDPNTRKNNAANIFIKARARARMRLHTSRTAQAPAAPQPACAPRGGPAHPAPPRIRASPGRKRPALRSPRTHPLTLAFLPARF
jgi:hypothetical protein